MSPKSIPAGPVRACSPREEHGHGAISAGRVPSCGVAFRDATADMAGCLPTRLSAALAFTA